MSATTALDPAPVARFRRDLAELIDLERDAVLVALSGGPDSVALLLLTHAVLGERCRAATVDHGLRAASADEARAAAALCARFGIAHIALTAPLPARVGRTANLSARARALRYRLLGEHAGDAWIATGHHSDDQLETLIMRLNRGAGVGGLAGIRHRSGRTIRPLLGWRHSELAALVASVGIRPADDPSNRDDRFDRARLRKVLAGADWLDRARIGTSVAALAQADEALHWAAAGLAEARITEDDAGIALDPAGLPEELVRRLVVQCLGRVLPDVEVRGPAVAALTAALHRGEAGELAGVKAVARGGTRPRFVFTLAPPRRGTRPA
ncbi:MAG: tRNA lysidine(34) synthetase TilS [Pseudomonadota bacterium]